MSSHYFNRPYFNLPNYYGDAYIPPNYAAWNNYSVPFALPTGYFYSPHYYSPRNDFQEITNVVCKSTSDNRYCPITTEVISPKKINEQLYVPSMCLFDQNRLISSTQTLAECEYPGNWPMEISKN